MASKTSGWWVIIKCKTIPSQDWYWCSRRNCNFRRIFWKLDVVTLRETGKSLHGPAKQPPANIALTEFIGMIITPGILRYVNWMGSLLLR